MFIKINCKNIELIQIDLILYKMKISNTNKKLKDKIKN